MGVRLTCFWLLGSVLTLQSSVGSASPADRVGHALHEQLHAIDRPEATTKPEYLNALSALRVHLDANPDHYLEAAYQSHEALSHFWNSRDRAISGLQESLIGLAQYPDDADTYLATAWLAEGKTYGGLPMDAIDILRPVYERGLLVDPPQSEQFFVGLAMANALSVLGDYQEALNVLNQFYPLPPGLRKSDNASRLDYLIGKVQERLGDLEAAAEFYASALDWQFANPDESLDQAKIVFTLRLGTVQRRLGKLDLATQRFEEAIAFAEVASLPEQVMIAKTELAAVALADGRANDAYAIAKEAQPVFEAHNNWGALTTLKALLGEIELVRGDTQSAIDYLSVARGEIEASGSVEEIANVNQQLAQALWNHGDRENAFETLNSSMASLRQASAARENSQLANLRGHFQSERMANRNRLLEQENEVSTLRMQRQTILTTLVAVIAGTLFLVLYRQRKHQKHLQRMAHSDSLTGLLNHRRVFEVGEDLTALANRESQPLSVVMIDIDHFKQVNDRFGHAAGDVTLQWVSALLSAGLRKRDRVGRMGGEEFLLLLDGARASEATRIAERMRLDIERGPTTPASTHIPVTVSLGVAELAEVGGSFSQMVSKADERLYEAKRTGRNRVVCDSADVSSQLLQAMPA